MRRRYRPHAMPRRSSGIDLPLTLTYVGILAFVIVMVGWGIPAFEAWMMGQ